MWMTKKKIQQVRNKLIGLCLQPGQVLKVAPPSDKRFFGVPYVEIYMNNGAPVFSYQFVGSKQTLRFYFKNDRFDLEVAFNGRTHDVPKPMAFRHEIAEVPWRLIKFYAQHFPFVATSNYFINNGGFVA